MARCLIVRPYADSFESYTNTLYYITVTFVPGFYMLMKIILGGCDTPPTVLQGKKSTVIITFMVCISISGGVSMVRVCFYGKILHTKKNYIFFN